MISPKDTDPGRADAGQCSTTDALPAPGNRGDNSASELIEAPLAPDHDPLDPHDFGDGGGGGGAEAFRRAPRPAPR